MNYNLTLNDILSDAISELKNEISYKIKNNLEFRYQDPLQEFKNVINKYFEKFNFDFKENYRFFFDSYRVILLDRTEQIQSDSIEVITSLTPLIKEGFENGLKDSLYEIGNLINENNFSIKFNNETTINNILNKLFMNIALTIPNIESNLNPNINNLKDSCNQELKREKDIFKDNVTDTIIKGFNNTVETFIKVKGKSYLENLFLDDYENKIRTKLDYQKKKNIFLINFFLI